MYAYANLITSQTPGYNQRCMSRHKHTGSVQPPASTNITASIMIRHSQGLVCVLVLREQYNVTMLRNTVISLAPLVGHRWVSTEYHRLSVVGTEYQSLDGCQALGRVCKQIPIYSIVLYFALGFCFMCKRLRLMRRSSPNFYH